MSTTELLPVFDEAGATLRFKARSDIDRQADILAAVYVFVIKGNGDLVLATIPDDRYGSRGSYVGKIGFAVASFLRQGEDAAAAAHRALLQDLGVKASELRLLKQGYQVFSDGLRRQAAVFLVRHDGPFTPDQYAASALHQLSLGELQAGIAAHPDRYAASLLDMVSLLVYA